MAIPDPDVLLVIGNGLSVNLGRHLAPALDAWDTSSPLSWNIQDPSTQPTPFHRPAPLLDVLPNAARALRAARALLPEANDFEVLNAAARHSAKKGEDEALRAGVELRHLVALYFSHYQAAVDKLDWAGWELGIALQELLQSGKILGAFSLKYDLNFERLVEMTGMSTLDLDVSECLTGSIALAKPHGSIDYMPDRYMEFGPGVELRYPTWVFSQNIDTPWIKRIPPDQLISVRTSVDLVLPAEQSRIRKFQWLEPGQQWLSQVGSTIKTLVIIGVSYMPVDRPELDEIFSKVNPRATAAVYDPCPSEDLVTALSERFAAVEKWGTSFRPLHRYAMEPAGLLRQHPPYPDGSIPPGSERQWSRVWPPPSNA